MLSSVWIQIGFKFRAPGFWFPEWCFWFPWCFFSRNGVFSSRRVRWFPRCFQFPGWGVFSSQIRACCSRNGVLGARGCFLFPEWCFRFPARGNGMAVFVIVCGSRMVFLLASSCFSAFLCSLLPSFFFFSFLISSASALLPVIFVSFRPFLPSPFLFSSCASFNLPSVLPFLAS